VRAFTLREAYRCKVLSANTIVHQVLEPWQHPPMPPPAVVTPGAPYLPSSQLMLPATIVRFRGLAWDLIERSTDDPEIRARALAVVDALLARLDGEAVPGRPMRAMADAEVVEMYCELVRIVTDVRDPYAALKAEYNAQALAALPAIHEIVDRVADPEARLLAAINLGIMANAIDFADPTRRRHLETNGFDVAAELTGVAALRYVEGLDERPALARAMRAAPTGPVLFLADNAGEIIFDLPLIRLWLEQGRAVTLVGKSVPCYNDMTTEELVALCEDQTVRRYLGERAVRDRVRVIAGGTATIGLDLRRATDELVGAWSAAAIIYAKGQGMVQTLRYAPLTRDLFHAVQVKDPAYFHERVPVAAGDALFLHTQPTSDGGGVKRT